MNWCGLGGPLPGIDYPVGQFPVCRVEGGEAPPPSSNVLLTRSKFFFLFLKEITPPPKDNRRFLFFMINTLCLMSSFLLGYALCFQRNKSFMSFSINKAGARVRLSSQPKVS